MVKDCCNSCLVLHQFMGLFFNPITEVTMTTQKIFCKGCGRKLNYSPLPMLYGETVFEFEDGFYCERCAIERTKRKRKAIKK